MRAGKKQVAESGQTRPCIVYLKNLREEAESAGGRLRKRDPRELQLQQREQALRETTRRAGRSVGVPIQEKPASRTRQAQVAAKTPAVVASPSPPKATPKTTPTSAAVMAKRRSTVVLGNSHHKLTSIGQRRGTHTETPATPKMFKQAAAKLLAPSPPPTIAASRSRRSIKPNPKYASEDIVTPKYMAALGGDGGSPVSGSSRHRSQAKPMYTEISDLLDLDEDNDDELADVAFNPQLHKSDEDDDDEEFISDGEFEQELRLEKLPAAKRGRGRPPKANNVRTPSSAAANTAATAANRVFHKLEVNSSQGRSPATNIQQLRRTLAGTIARNNASMTADSGGGTAKRKLEASESESPVARKRLVISSGSGGGHRSVPVVNGAAKRSTTPSAHAATTTTISRPKVGGAGNTPRMQPQRSAGVFKVNPATPNTPIPNVTNSSTRSTRGAAGGGAAAAAASEASTKDESEADDMPTFTIVNIDDIINQDDVLISRSNNAAAAAARGGASRKLAKGRLRARDILTSNTVGSAAAEKKTLSSIEKSPPAAISSPAAKRLKILASSSNSNSSGNNTKPRPSSQQASPVPKPRPRILNTEMGKKTQPMKPLMSMGKELCPTDVDTEEDDPDPDLDLDLDLDEPPASIVTRRSTPRQAQAQGSGSGSGSGQASPETSNKWNSNRRNVLATTASPNAANARADRKLTKLLAETSDEPAVFKKPSLSPQRRSKENQQQQQQQEQRDKEETASKKDTAATAAAAATAGQASNTSATVLSSPQKYFPPETTIFSEEEGRVVKKITCYETWHVINLPTEPPASTNARQQRTCLELALVKLANVAARIKVPSSKWSSKVTLYKVSPTLMQRQQMTIFTGDLNAYNIPEEDRHKYQPSCVLFRRTAVDKAKSRVPYDRAIIFKNKCFYANIDGKQVNLMGAPEAVATVKEVEILLDIVDRLTLTSQLVEMVNTK